MAVIIKFSWILLALAWGAGDETAGRASGLEVPRGVDLASRGLDLVSYTETEMECGWETLNLRSAAASRLVLEPNLGLFVHIGTRHVVDIGIDHDTASPPTAVPIPFMRSWRRRAVESSLPAGLLVTKLSISCPPDAIPKAIWTEHLRAAPRWERRVWATYWLQYYKATLSRLEHIRGLPVLVGRRCVRRASNCDALLQPAYARTEDD